MIFALLRSWSAALKAERQSRNSAKLSARRQSESVIFAMEEPELFLHPHAQRRLSSSLRSISQTPEHQVFLCTHSTHFVDLSHYNEVAIIRKDNPIEGSTVRQCTDELFEGTDLEDKKKSFHMAQWINPDRAELFFARRVVFVEGETEKVILPYLGDIIGEFDPDVSVIDCGSKHNLPLYIMIANAFHIPYLVVHDEDPLPSPIPGEWNKDKRRSKQSTFELNQTIEQLVVKSLGSIQIMAPSFEVVSGVSKSRGKKEGKPLAALHHFEAMVADDIPGRIRSLVRKSYGDS